MFVVPVRLGAQSYNIDIAPGALHGLGDWTAKLPLGKRCIVVSDSNVARLYGAAAVKSLSDAGFSVELIALLPGENSKSLKVLEDIHTAAIRFSLDRGGFFAALGGGVVGDLTGFAAGTYMRGVPFIQIPTTLLAQVDSSVGGKTAVNHPLGKNLIGLFYQPAGVLIDPLVLSSLPEREFASGMAEVLKYGISLDADFLQMLQDSQEQIRKCDPGILGKVIERCCVLKAAIVEEDEKEAGRRMVLNFGHTAGHAVEAAGGFSRYTHGEAVAIGMMAAARLSQARGMIESGVVDRVKLSLEAYNLPVAAGGESVSELLTFIASDKKRSEGTTRWILLKALGKATVDDTVPANLVTKILKEIVLEVKSS